MAARRRCASAVTRAVPTYDPLMAPAPRYDIRPASGDDDLRAILALQAANRPEALEAGERAAQGFVTLRHDLALLREMNEPYPHIVATPAGAEEVVAYALVMRHAFRSRLPDLEPMYEQMERMDWRGRALMSWRSYTMGQVCVAKPHRGRGLVERMYAAHRAQMAPHFDLMITEIDRANPRSIRAHEKCGCEVAHEYAAADGREWVVVVMDLWPGSAHGG